MSSSLIVPPNRPDKITGVLIATLITLCMVLGTWCWQLTARIESLEVSTAQIVQDITPRLLPIRQ